VAGFAPRQFGRSTASYSQREKKPILRVKHDSQRFLNQSSQVRATMVSPQATQIRGSALRVSSLRAVEQVIAGERETATFLFTLSFFIYVAWRRFRAT